MKSKALYIWLLLMAFLIGFVLMKAKSALDTVIDKMASAIQDWEDGKRDGILTAGTIAGNNNNPGNIRFFGDLDSIPWTGAIGVDQFNHVVFATYQDGWNALTKQLRLAFTNQSSVYNSSMNLFDFFSHYAEANWENYARFVASKLNVDPNMSLEQIAKAA